MQIVIEIPEVIYHMVMNTGTYGMYRFNTTKAIKEGVVLPEEHDRLIEANKACEHDCSKCHDHDICGIYNAPTVLEASKE